MRRAPRSFPEAPGNARLAGLLVHLRQICANRSRVTQQRLERSSHGIYQSKGAMGRKGLGEQGVEGGLGLHQCCLLLGLNRSCRVDELAKSALVFKLGNWQIELEQLGLRDVAHGVACARCQLAELLSCWRTAFD